MEIHCHGNHPLLPYLNKGMTEKQYIIGVLSMVLQISLCYTEKNSMLQGRGNDLDAAYLMKNRTAHQLYQQIKDLPIVDYHCHLSPREIYEDKVFSNIGEMWLNNDHYKWRLMRQAGVPERLVTGSGSWKEKFAAYMQALEFAAGNPVYHWTQMELAAYFHCQFPICRENTEKIWTICNQQIQEAELSPRKLIHQAKVEYIATTDEILDSLEYHKQLQEDPEFSAVITPSFRTDRLLLIQSPVYTEYIKRLEILTKKSIATLEQLLEAVEQRLVFFQTHGCRFSDLGIPFFPVGSGSKEEVEAEAEAAFSEAVQGRPVSEEGFQSFLTYMIVQLNRLYRKYHIVSQWHMQVLRNVNTSLYEKCGSDSGGDCMGNSVDADRLAYILNEIQGNSGLPRMILYSLNPADCSKIMTVAGSFRNAVSGAAWWFCDHRRGIREVLETIAETGYLAMFPGMLTDSRSYLSYIRHDYFRRIVCDLLGQWVEEGTYPHMESALRLAKQLVYYNTKALAEKEGSTV